jgi:hypothetical protein
MIFIKHYLKQKSKQPVKSRITKCPSLARVSPPNTQEISVNIYSKLIQEEMLLINV